MNIMSISLPFTNKNDWFLNIHRVNPSRAHHPVVVEKKGLPASLERRMLYLTFGYPRGAPLCFSGMFGVEFRWGSRSCLTEIERD